MKSNAPRRPRCRRPEPIRNGLFAFLWALIACMMTSGCIPSSGPRSPEPPSPRPIRSWPIEEPGRVSTTLGEAHKVVSNADSLYLHLVLGESNDSIGSALCLALPPDCSPRVELERMVLRQVAPWYTDIVGEEETARILQEAARDIPSMISITYQGLARRTHLYRFLAQSGFTLTGTDRRYQILEVSLHVRWDKAHRPQTINDSAYFHGNTPWLEMLSLVVTNRSALIAFADPLPARAQPTYPAIPVNDWEPVPATKKETLPPLKIFTEEEGLYAIDLKTLMDAGWTPDSLSPKGLRLFNLGREVPTRLVGGLSARFTVQDRLLFWAEAMKSPMTRANAYFLAPAEDASPSRMMTPEWSATTTARVYADWPMVTRIEHDERLETKEGNFLSIRDMRWVWRELPRGKAVELFFDLPGHRISESPAGNENSLEVILYAGRGRMAPRGRLDVDLNGVAFGDLTLEGSFTPANLRMEFPSSALKEKDNRFSLVWKGEEKTASLFLDALEINHRRRLEPDDKGLMLDVKDEELFDNTVLRVVGVAEADLIALDLSSGERPVILPARRVEGAAAIDVQIVNAHTRRIGLFRMSSLRSIARIAPSSWKPLRRVPAAADGIIITHSLFASTAEAIADLWRREGHATLIVDVESLYDTYTGGLLDPAAIKLFLGDLLERTEAQKPQVALLLGDCTSDYRGLFRNPVVNYVPSYSHESLGLSEKDRYASDQWFATLLGKDDYADVLLGRISVANPDDAQAVLEKMRQAREFPAGLWSRTVGLIADHGNFPEVCEELRTRILSPAVYPRLVYLDREPFEDNFYLAPELLEGDEVKVSPSATSRIQSLFDEGSAIIAFYGHGSPNIWSNQRIWFGGDSPNSDNRRLSNRAQLPLVFNGTCNSGAIDYPMPPWNICISEDMMRQPNGGALACFVPSGPGYTSNHRVLSKALFRAAFELGGRRIGPICEAARMSYKIREKADDHARMFVLLGDPLSALPRPAGEGAFETLRVTPVSEAGGAGRAYRLRAETPPLKDATLKAQWMVLDDDGHPMMKIPEHSLKGDRAILEVDLSSTTMGMLHVLCYLFSGSDSATGSQRGDDYCFGGRIRVDPSPVSIAPLSLYPPGILLEPDRTQVRILIPLTNNSGVPAEGSLVLERLNASMRGEPFPLRTFQLDALEKQTLSAEIPVKPGINLFAARVIPSKTVLPDPLSVAPPPVAAAVPSTNPNLHDIALQVLSIEPVRRQSGHIQALVKVLLANLGGVPWPGGSVRVVMGKNTTPIKQPVVGILQPSQIIHSELLVPWPVGKEPVSWTVDVECIVAEWKDMNPENNVGTVSVNPRELPDLALVSGSLQITPPSPSDGETVFLEVTVENQGTAPSAPFQCIGYAQDDSGREIRMPNRAQLASIKHPALAPGENRRIQLRWDPTRNAGTRRLAVLVDPFLELPDANPNNNRLEATLHVRSKWKLVPRGLTVANWTQDSVTLLARIANEGETAARYVVVAFYPDDNFSRENRLAEVLRERIEPGETAEFEYIWHFRPEDRARPARPAFQAYIKGSMLRVSNIGE